ncbi:unnamed protein product, partial [Tetraodon nigroviridis]
GRLEAELQGMAAGDGSTFVPVVRAPPPSVKHGSKKNRAVRKRSSPWQPRNKPDPDDVDHGNGGRRPGQQPGSSPGAGRHGHGGFTHEQSLQTSRVGVARCFYLAGFLPGRPSRPDPGGNPAISGATSAQRGSAHILPLKQPINPGRHT